MGGNKIEFFGGPMDGKRAAIPIDCRKYIMSEARYKKVIYDFHIEPTTDLEAIIRHVYELKESLLYRNIMLYRGVE